MASLCYNELNLLSWLSCGNCMKWALSCDDIHFPTVGWLHLIMNSDSFHWGLNYLFKSTFRLTTKKYKLCITGLWCWETKGNRWIHHPKSQWCEKLCPCDHVVTSSWSKQATYSTVEYGYNTIQYNTILHIQKNSDKGTHWFLGDLDAIFKNAIFNLLLIDWYLIIMLSDEWHGTLLMMSQHWFR